MDHLSGAVRSRLDETPQCRRRKPRQGADRDGGAEHRQCRRPGNADMHAERGGGGCNERSDAYHRGEALLSLRA